MHVLSLLDSMLNMGMTSRGRDSRHNFGLIEAVLCRQADFWSSMEDITLIAMMLQRVMKAKACMDIEEIFERAEIRLLALLNYDPDTSTKLNITRIRQSSKQLASAYDIRSLSDIALAFLQTGTGALIFQCLAIVTEHGLEWADIVEECGHYVRLVNCLHMAGMSFDKEMIAKLPTDKLTGAERHIRDYLILSLSHVKL